jgi:hypothetical protein
MFIVSTIMSWFKGVPKNVMDIFGPLLKSELAKLAGDFKDTTIKAIKEANEQKDLTNTQKFDFAKNKVKIAILAEGKTVKDSLVTDIVQTIYRSLETQNKL